MIVVCIHHNLYGFTYGKSYEVLAGGYLKKIW